MSPSKRNKLLIGIGGAVGLLVVVLLIAPSFFDLNKYKPELVSEVKKATGRDLVLDGPVTLSLLPTPSVGVSKAEGTAQAQNGTLDIPVAASGLAYKFADATADAGQLTIKSENPQSTPHNIAIEGNGADDKGKIVASGGVSEFNADLKPGDYTFFCSVPGHREGGMEGKLTVK